MVRPKDKFWEHVEELENRRFKCKFCERDFPGGITRVKSHLSGAKGHDVSICTKVPRHVQEAAYLAISGSKKKARKDSDDVDIHSPSKNTMNLCIKKDKDEVDKLLLEHFLLNDIPFNVVQSPSFIHLVKKISEYGAGYELPCYTTFTTKLVSDSKTEVDKYIEKVKESWAKTGCTLMCGIWSDMKQRAFMNVVAYSPKGAVFLKSSEIQKTQKVGVYLKDLLFSIIEDIGPEHVVQFIGDNAINFESAGELIGKYPHMYQTRCVARGIQLLWKDIYDEVSWVRKVIDDSKLIVEYMYKHTDVLSVMRVHTNDRELKHPCMTGFASNFLMLQSILNVENELRRLVVSSEWVGLDYGKKEKGKVTAVIQSSEFWNEGKEVLQVMEPMIRVLRLVDGHGPTSGYLYEAMERVNEAIKQRSTADESKFMKMLELFKARRSNIIQPIHTAAAFLNPAYMCNENVVEDCVMNVGVDFILDNLISSEEKEDFRRDVDSYRRLFTKSATTNMKTLHPGVWWDNCGDTLPVLKKCAVRILRQPCSSSTCKMNWSAFEGAQTKKSNRLTPEMLHNLIHIRMNMLMMKKFNKMEKEELEPINLDKLNELIEYDYYEQDVSENELLMIKKSDNIMNEADCSRNCMKEMHSSESGPLKLQFSNNLSPPIFTGTQIEGEEHSTLQVPSVDCATGEIILGADMSDEMWEVTEAHARTCVLEETIDLSCPSNSQQITGQVMGQLSDGQYIPTDKLSETHKADASSMLKSASDHREEVEYFDGEAFLTGVSAQFSSSSPPCSSLSKFFSPDRISSLHCFGETSGSDIYALPAVDVDNIGLWSDHITQGHFFDCDFQSQNVRLESPGDLQTAVDGFLFTRSTTVSIKAQKRWTKLGTVVKWFSKRASLKGTNVGKIQ